MRSLTDAAASSFRCDSKERFGDALSFARLRAAWIGRPKNASTFFRTLGSHLEIALANAHAYERELRRAQERETFAEAARTILSHTAIGSLADVMCRLASRSCTPIERAYCVGTANAIRIVGVSASDVEERSRKAASTSCIAPSV